MRIFSMTIAIILVCVGVSGCGALPTDPVVQINLSSPTFSGAESMAIESDLVILGTVSAVEEGRAAGEGAEQIRFRDVTVEVEEVFLSRGAPVLRVVVQEFGWDAGKAVENPDMPWSKVGQRGYFFLQRDVPEKFGYLGPQARIWIEDGQLHSGGNHELKAVRHVNEMSQEAFMAEVVAATQKVSQQQIKNPDGPAVGDGDRP